MFQANSAVQTIELAKKIGKLAKPGDVLVMTGDLGAGKTTFTKGIAEGLGIDQMIKSPTYTIIREYQQGRLPLYHMDVYRVTQGAEDLGLDDYFEGDGLTVVEWGNQLGECLPIDYVELIMTKDATQVDTRYFELSAHGKRAAEFSAMIQREWEKLK